MALKPPGLVLKINVKDLETGLEALQGCEQYLKIISSSSLEDQILTKNSKDCVPGVSGGNKDSFGGRNCRTFISFLEKFMFTF